MMNNKNQVILTLIVKLLAIERDRERDRDKIQESQNLLKTKKIMDQKTVNQEENQVNMTNILKKNSEK